MQGLSFGRKQKGLEIDYFPYFLPQITILLAHYPTKYSDRRYLSEYLIYNPTHEEIYVYCLSRLLLS
jgi:hypothetical protein